MENWEQQVARILGVPVTGIEKNYYGKNQTDVLQVNEEQLLTFYDYLRDELTLPFFVRIDGASVTCLRLEAETEVDVSYGIRMECEKEGEKRFLPLSDLIVVPSDTNAIPIQLYQAWLKNHR
ncbi:hypothetical protein WMZ97_11165 [Lentibacillus sp. N15]|uniref:hypothetical protein n=1 Tax=Lentibacillus songyuanensis TaxID=3136161 RepID=UPI0031BA409A